VESFIGKPSASLATPIVGNATDKREMLLKLYTHVQSLRNLTFENEKSEQELNREKLRDPKNAGDVIKSRYGSRDELNRAFVFLARSAGFEADVVRVAPRDERFFSKTVPDADQMSTEVAVVTLEDKPLYLDPGTPGAPFGVVSWEKSTTTGIRFSKKGGPTWLEVPGAAPAAALMKRSANLRLTGEVLEGTVTVAYSGQEALVRRVRALNEDDAARKKALEDEVKAWFPDGSTATLKEVTGDKTHEDVFQVTFDVTLPNAVSRAGSRTVVPMSVFASTAKNPFAPTTRTHAIYFPYARSEEDEVKLTLPDGLAPPSLPAPVNANAGSVVYKNETKLNGKELVFKRSMFIDVIFVDVKYYGALRNFFSAMTTADQRPIVLEKVR
jgi:hypothetical protein